MAESLIKHKMSREGTRLQASLATSEVCGCNTGKVLGHSTNTEYLSKSYPMPPPLINILDHITISLLHSSDPHIWAIIVSLYRDMRMNMSMVRMMKMNMSMMRMMM